MKKRDAPFNDKSIQCITPEREPVLLTLCIVHDNKRVLLGEKKRGFGKGNINGFGGKVHDGETIEAAAIRELEEEACIKAETIHKVGILFFTFTDGTQDLEVHLFRVPGWSGTPAETEEMKPMWYNIDGIPYDNMWADDIHWMPLLLKGKRFQAEFSFSDQSTIIDYTITLL
jgi:8-oxo-dGTP pyrophosphatase MutT (NUDIX family)